MWSPNTKPNHAFTDLVIGIDFYIFISLYDWISLQFNEYISFIMSDSHTLHYLNLGHLLNQYFVSSVWVLH